MQDDSGRHSNSEGQAQAGNGPDTVRILPDSAPQKARGGQSAPEDEWYVEQPVVRSGTLYTHIPAEQEAGTPTPPPYAATSRTPVSRAVEPVRSTREVVSTADRSLQAPDVPVPAPVTIVRKGPSACAIMAATLSLLLLSCAALAFFTVSSGFDGLGKLGGWLPSFSGIVITPTTTIDTSRPTVIDRVQALSKLVTVNYELEKVVSAKSSGPLPDFLTSDRILLVAHGEVAAGVDLAQLKPGDVTVVSDTVTVKLPRPEILFSSLDNDKTYVYDRQTGLFNEPDPNLETEIRRVAEQEILNTAIEDGILIKAGDNAKGVLRSLITGLGYKEVEFIDTP